MKNICSGLVLALTLAATTAFAQDIAPEGAVACISRQKLAEFVDARDSNDRNQLAELFKGDCRALEGSEYSIVEDRNGSMKILVFRKPGDWESAQAYFTLDELLQVD
jgi:hypothetical protein